MSEWPVRCTWWLECMTMSKPSSSGRWTIRAGEGVVGRGDQAALLARAAMAGQVGQAQQRIGRRLHPDHPRCWGLIAASMAARSPISTKLNSRPAERLRDLVEQPERAAVEVTRWRSRGRRRPAVSRMVEVAARPRGEGEAGACRSPGRRSQRSKAKRVGFWLRAVLEALVLARTGLDVGRGRRRSGRITAPVVGSGTGRRGSCGWRRPSGSCRGCRSWRSLSAARQGVTRRVVRAVAGQAGRGRTRRSCAGG